jgi:peptide/nickel transport system ATP-binding protein
MSAMVPLLEARNITKTFTASRSAFQPAKTVTAVDGVNLTLYPGETLGVAGESGCGKSTLARILMGLVPPASGSILFKGAELSSLPSWQRKEFRKTVQMIFQDPFSSLNPRMRTGEIIREPMIIHRLYPVEMQKEKVIELMERVGLYPDQYDRYPHEFSGGQRQRIGIARALAVAPAVIIADEPLSALDISIQAQIINLLLDLQGSLNLAYLIISHDLAVIRHLSNRVLVMYLGRIVEEGATEAIYSSFLHPYTEALLAAIPGSQQLPGLKKVSLGDEQPSAADIPPGCAFHPRCQYCQEICRRVTPELLEIESGHKSACHFSTALYRS